MNSVNPRASPQKAASPFWGELGLLLCVLIPYFGIGTAIGMDRPSPVGSVVGALVAGGFISLGWFMVLGQHGGGLMPAIMRDSRSPVTALAVCFALFIAFTYGSILLGAKLKNYPEARAKGQLALYREALNRYRDDNSQQFPKTLEVLTAGGKYLPAAPPVDVPVSTPKSSNSRHSDMRFSHNRTAAVFYGTKPNDSGGWFYANAPDEADYGTIRINCTHADLNGKVWASY